jgi:hypothetical protein
MKKMRKNLSLSLVAVVLTVFGVIQLPRQQPHAVAQTSDSLRKQREHKKLYKNYKSEKKLSTLAVEAMSDFKIIEGVPQKVFRPDSPRITSQEFLSRLLCNSDAVVVGTIKDKISALTEEDNFIFTDYELLVEDILKNNVVDLIQPDIQITITRPGGTIRLHGQNVTALDEAFPLLQTGSRYLLFLQFIPATGAYKTATGTESYLIRNKRLIKLTAESRPPDLEAGNDAGTFVDSIRQAAKGTCSN